MVPPSRQPIVKRLHCSRDMGEKLPVRGAGFERAVGRMGSATRCIAIWPELWFDGLGFPLKVPSHVRRGAALRGVAALGQASRRPVRELGPRSLDPGARILEALSGGGRGGGRMT